jgi:hypothetical protein
MEWSERKPESNCIIEVRHEIEKDEERSPSIPI